MMGLGWDGEEGEGVGKLVAGEEWMAGGERKLEVWGGCGRGGGEEDSIGLMRMERTEKEGFSHATVHPRPL